MAHALWRPGEHLLNADSRQVYRGMDIATAKPTRAERLAYPWELLDLRDPREPFTAKDWLDEASAAWAAGGVCWAVGGTSFYFDVLAHGLFEQAEIPPGARERLAVLMGRGLAALRDEVVRRDPEYAQGADLQNPRRLERAFLAMEVSGRKYSELRLERRAPPIRLRMAVLFLPRKTIYNRIEARVAAMLAGGLLDETRALLKSGVPESAPAMTGIGYAEAAGHLAGRLALGEVRERMVLRTRQFARRQVGAFRRFQGATFVDLSGAPPGSDAEDAWFYRLPLAVRGEPIPEGGARLPAETRPAEALRQMMEETHAA
ncbi:MAG: tRNA (adenosine(37)-N6)-dimethylallyltransferase MiaA [Spirochaetes bacterium]|nr:tRNA (adenosine(37)-N6)-dimethylallyltransferase MiaA [Spirochaetota bacterium]